MALPAWWFGTLLAVIGGAWLILGRGGAVRTSASGIAFCLAGGFSYALYALANKRLVQQSDPGVVTWVVFSVGALLALPLTWALAGPVQLAGSGWWVVLFLGVVATASTCQSGDSTQPLPCRRPHAMQSTANLPTIRMYIAKNVFQIHAVDPETGEVELIKLRRSRVLTSRCLKATTLCRNAC